MSKLTLIFTVIILGFAPSAWAGWVVEYASGDVSYLSSGKMKEGSKEDGTYSLLEAKTGLFSLFVPGKKLYWQGTSKELCSVMQQLIPQLEQKLAKPSIDIQAAGNERIAGMATKKYQVMVNGQLAREVWIAENQNLASENEALDKAGEDFAKCYPAQTTEEMVDSDPAYRKIESQGFVMKEVTYHSDMPVDSSEVISLRQEDIPDSEFEVPAGYRRVQSMMEIYQ